MRITMAPPHMVGTASKYSTPANTISAMLVTAKYWFVT